MARADAATMGNSKGLGELWARLRFLLLAIIVYRIGTHIPVPGFDPERLSDLFNQNQVRSWVYSICFRAVLLSV